ncbi:glycosyltransferase [Marivita sp. S2033]|uniref:glycosyltransferase n=1 Tax=Marivita sp. S2033 TaxID=3373187 RepID=UPI0039820A48
MQDRIPTRIVCIVPRLGASVGGGKMNAIFRRMNLLSERENTQVILLNLHHGVKQKIAFSDLAARGVFDPRVTHLSLHEFCAPSGTADPPALPDWDDRKTTHRAKTRVSYYSQGALVMRDTVDSTSAGDLTIRHILTDPDRDVRLKYLDSVLVEALARFGDGIVEKTLYAQGRPVCTTRQEHKAFLYADCALTGQRYRDEKNHQKALVANLFPDNCIVFVDGITSAYLSRHIPAQKVLFLHADHRAPDGSVVPRSRSLIETFDGDAIITATHVHKARLEADTRHTAPIRVIPHYADSAAPSDGPRAHICTVSRLELQGKPIHHCIEAFARIMHLIPGCDYLIYGSGLGQARLEQLVAHLNCADRVFLMGHTSNAAAVFNASLLSLAPTMTEGFGLALLESLAHGCPVISYDVDYGPRELVQPGHNGELVRPGDIDAIAQAILKVHAQRDRYAAGCAETAQRYSFDVYSRNYHHLIDDLTGQGFAFDIAAPDLRAEVAAALETAPQAHKPRLLDLYIDLSAQRRDLDGMYRGFQQKATLLPQMQRPLLRCIWLSRRLGRVEECREHLDRFAQRFPVNHTQFVTRHPEFLEFTEAGV